MDVKSGFKDLFSYKSQIIYGLATTLITIGLFFDVRQWYDYDRAKLYFYAYILVAVYFSYQLYQASEKKNAYSSIGWFLIKFAEVLYLFIDIVNIYSHAWYYEKAFIPSFSILIVIILIQMVLMWLNQKKLVNNYDDNILSFTPEIAIQK